MHTSRFTILSISTNFSIIACVWKYWIMHFHMPTACSHITSNYTLLSVVGLYLRLPWVIRSARSVCTNRFLNDIFTLTSCQRKKQRATCTMPKFSCDFSLRTPMNNRADKIQLNSVSRKTLDAIETDLYAIQTKIFILPLFFRIAALAPRPFAVK